MNQRILPALVLIGALLVGAAGWTVLPSLQPAARKVESEASEHFERARRLLYQYHHGLHEKSLRLVRLARQHVALANSDAEPDVDEDAYHKLHEDRWTWYQPYDYSLPSDPRPVRAARYGNIPGQIRDGIGTRQRMLADNDGLLDDALQAVDAGLAVTAGGASAQQHAEGNRLRGIILYHQALADCADARAMRGEARQARRALVDLIQRFAAHVDDGSTTEADSSHQRLAALDEQIASAEQKIDALESERADLDRQIAVLTAKRDGALASAKQARRELERLQAEGIDLTDKDGAAVFESAVRTQSEAFRQAERRAAELLHGAYVNAMIDASGDFLHGKYAIEVTGEAPTIVPGITALESRRGVVASQVDVARSGLQQLQSTRDELRAAAAQRNAKAKQLRIAAAAAKSTAQELYDEVNKLQSEAFAIEDEALANLGKALRAQKTAADAARAWAGEVASSVSAMSPAAKQRSAIANRSESGWMSGHINAQVADAHLARAWIEYWRFVDYGRNAEVLSQDGAHAFLSEASAEAEATKAAEAKEHAIVEIESAMSVLQRAHRSGGRHWSFVAQAGTANDLMALLGLPQYVSDAVEAYQTAIQGKQDEPYTRPYRSRLARLQNR